MTRQFPAELFIGQKILVRPNPTAYPIEALVTAFDRLKGFVHFTMQGYPGQYMARAHAITTEGGQYLHFEDAQFVFKATPFFAS